MSDKKIGLESVGLQKDEQFRIISLVIEDSSEGSSRRDDGYEIRHYDVSDQQQHDKKSIKSLQEIQTNEIEKRGAISPNLSKISNENEPLPKNAFNNQSPQQQKDDFGICQTDGFQTELNKDSSTKNRKRTQIFRNPRKSNFDKQKTTEQQEIDEGNKSKQVLNRVAFEKKRQNHTMLKHWNYCRIRKLQFHRSIAQQIIKNIDQNVKLSLENFEVYRSFYAQRQRQEQIYADKIFIDSDRLIENDETLEQNDLSYNIYIACSSIFQSMTRKDKKQKQMAQNFANLIQTKILKQIFGEYFDNVHKQSLLIRAKINQTKVALQKIDESVCKKLISLETNFTECCQDVNKQGQKDFYRSQLSFLRKCESQMLIEQKYGQLILEYHNFVISEQQMRRQLIQKSLRIYEQGLKKYESQLWRVSKQKVKEQNTKNDSQERSACKQKEYHNNMQIKQLYEIKNLISSELLQNLQEKLQKSHQEEDTPINRQVQQQFNHNFQLFFLNCDIDTFDCHHLILRRFQVLIVKQEIWIPGSIVISVDKFVHFFINAAKPQDQLVYGSRVFCKPETTIKAKMVEIAGQDKEKDEVEIKIGCKLGDSRLDKLKQLLKSRDKLEERVRFEKESDFFEFEDYIANLSK